MPTGQINRQYPRPPLVKSPKKTFAKKNVAMSEESVFKKCSVRNKLIKISKE